MLHQHVRRGRFSTSPARKLGKPSIKNMILPFLLHLSIFLCHTHHSHKSTFCDNFLPDPTVVSQRIEQPSQAHVSSPTQPFVSTLTIRKPAPSTAPLPFRSQSVRTPPNILSDDDLTFLFQHPSDENTPHSSPDTTAMRPAVVETVRISFSVCGEARGASCCCRTEP